MLIIAMVSVGNFLPPQSMRPSMQLKQLESSVLLSFSLVLKNASILASGALKKKLKLIKYSLVGLIALSINVINLF